MSRWAGRQIAVVGYDQYGQLVGQVPGMGLMPIQHASPAMNMQRMAPQGGMAQTAMQQIALPPQAPQWMGRQVAPGVQDLDEDLVPIELTPDTNGGVFTAATPVTITFFGRVQKPFQGERLLTTVVPTGASAAGARLLGIPYVGIDPQVAQIRPVNLSNFVAAAFGVRMKMKPVQPGVDLEIPCQLSVYPTGTDTVFVSITVLGKQYD